MTDEETLVRTPLTNMLFHKASIKRIPLSGTFEVTPRCNFDCRMCYIRHSEAEVKCHERTVQSLEEWKIIADEAVREGMLYLLITGGEPFLWKDFWPLYEYLKEKGLVISINTNGSLIDEQAVEKFKKSPPCRINITLYGASDETYEKLCRIRNGFQKVDKAVTLLCKAGIPVKLNCSLTPYNVCDLEKIVDYAKKRNLILDINPYMYPPVRKENFKPGFNERFSPEEVAYWHIKSKQLQYEKDAYLDFLQQIVQGTVKPPGLDEECYDSLDGQIRCRAGRAAFWVTWDGYMLPCGLMGAPETDLREYDFANAWKLMIQKADAVNLSGICNNCQNSSICHSCAAMAMAETGRFDGIPVYMCEMVKTMKKLAQEQLKIYGAE